MAFEKYKDKLYAVVADTNTYSICIITVPANAVKDSEGHVKAWGTFGWWYVNPCTAPASVFSHDEGTFGHRMKLFDSAEVNSHCCFISSIGEQSVMNMFSEKDKAESLAKVYLDMFKKQLDKEDKCLLAKSNIMAKSIPHNAIRMCTPIHKQIKQINEAMYALKEAKILYLDLSGSPTEIYPMKIAI